MVYPLGARGMEEMWQDRRRKEKRRTLVPYTIAFLGFAPFHLAPTVFASFTRI
jgi:hypothetical protein